MRVSDILRSKPTAGVITLLPSEKVSAAAALLAEKRIGTVVVSADGKMPSGILSERDIVREIGKRGGDCLTDSLSDLMTKEVQTCSPNDIIDSVLQRMTEGRFRHMPVVDDGSLVGLVTLGDVVKAQLLEVAREKDALTDMIMGHA